VHVVLVLYGLFILLSIKKWVVGQLNLLYYAFDSIKFGAQYAIPPFIPISISATSQEVFSFYAVVGITSVLL